MSALESIEFVLIEHPEEMDAEDISDILVGTSNALKYLSKNLLNKGENDIKWGIEKVTMSSPFHAYFTPPKNIDAKSYELVRNAFIFGQNNIAANNELPNGYDKNVIESLERVYSVSKRLGKKIRYITNSYAGFDSNVVLENNIHTILDSFQIPEHYEWTTLTGKLQEVGGKSTIGFKKPYFNLKPSLYNNIVKCYFDEDKFDEIQDDLKINPIEVSIYGKVKFNNKGEPLQVNDIKVYKKIIKKGALLNCKPDVVVNFTQGEDSADYIKRERDEIVVEENSSKMPLFHQNKPH